MDRDFCGSDTGDGCGRSFPNKSSPGLCAKCTKLASFSDGSTEYEQWKGFRQCESCGVAWKNLDSPICGRCASDNAKAATPQQGVATDPNIQNLARTAIEASRTARSHAMDARITKQPVGQQLHTTAGLTAARSSIGVGDNNVFITAQCRIKSTSVKDQKTTDPSCGQWGKPWPKDAYMSEVLDEYLATLNVRWSNEKGMALIPDEGEFRWAGNKLFLPGDVNKPVGEVYDTYLTGDMARYCGLQGWKRSTTSDQTLYKLNRKFKVPSVRRPPPDDIATQAVLEKVANDPSQRRGVGTISTLLSNEGLAIPRDFIRNVLATYAPEGLARRFPGVNRIPRSKLSALGPNHQHHADGHEKLNAQALNMGGVGLNIYGVKDQWSSYILHLVVVPNNRLATTIGHVYLDAVEKYELIPITFVTDKGSETGFLYANQTALREAYAPEIDKEQFPPMLQMRSVHNTPIEGLWHWFLQTFGHNIKDTIRSGFELGIYNPNNSVHPQLFYWLWPKILQIQLDQFVEYWNNHRIRAQADKPNMSGSTPRHAFTVPDLPAQQCGITVDQAVIDALRHQIPVSRKDSMRWVDDEFEVAATMAFSSIGEPPLSNLLSGWKIFTSMARVINVASSST